MIFLFLSAYYNGFVRFPRSKTCNGEMSSIIIETSFRVKLKFFVTSRLRKQHNILKNQQRKYHGKFFS